jgi:hypothetical protein
LRWADLAGFYVLCERANHSGISRLNFVGLDRMALDLGWLLALLQIPALLVVLPVAA